MLVHSLLLVKSLQSCIEKKTTNISKEGFIAYSSRERDIDLINLLPKKTLLSNFLQ
jgi:hypothetical protein